MFIFHHIPKTAGSTFSHAVSSANQEGSHIVGTGGLGSVPDLDFGTTRFLGGHITYPEAARRGLDSGNVHVSILRNPLERIVSNFEMAYRDDRVFREEVCSTDKWGLGFRVFYERFILDVGLANLQCQYFSEKAKFYDAVVSIDKNFHLVGSVSRFDYFVETAQPYLGQQNLARPKSFPKKNKSSQGENFEALIDEGMIARIKRENTEDFDLWNWLNSKNGGIFFGRSGEGGKEEGSL
jgi:hypothetical protein